MKKQLFYILLVFTFSSCSIEVEPTDRYSDGIAWRDEGNLDIYVKGFYTALKDNADIYTIMMSDGLSDILKYSVNNLNDITFQNKTLLQENNITPGNGVLSEWGNYAQIKRYNEFLFNAENHSANISSDFIKIRKSEVRFLRAYLYFLMARNHGGVILRLHNSGMDGGLDDESDVKKARASEEETWSFILTELQEVASGLKGHTWSATDYGRITEGAALALLARAGLFAEKYDVVIDAGHRIEALGYELEADYAKVFDGTLSKEIILPVVFDAPDYVHFFDRHFQPVADDPNRGGWAGPTEELVSHYQIKEGDTFVDFDWNNPVHASNPYANREPRFYVSILYNGADWKGRALQTYVGGSDSFVHYDPNADVPGNITGYYMRKFLDEDIADVDLGSSTAWIVFRLSEVYLNLAEAYGQKGDFTNAYNYLNKVRMRAGVPNRSAGANLSVFMSYLSTEKMTELAFEGHRYWDLRRWKKAEEVIAGKRATGVRIENIDGSLSYTRVTIESSDRVFPERYYYIPVPLSEIANNLLATQNIGW